MDHQQSVEIGSYQPVPENDNYQSGPQEQAQQQPQAPQHQHAINLQQFVPYNGVTIYPLDGRGTIPIYYKYIFSAKYEIVYGMLLIFLILLLLIDAFMSYIWTVTKFSQNCTGPMDSWQSIAQFIMTYYQIMLLVLLFCSKPNSYRKSGFVTVFFGILTAFSFIWVLTGYFWANAGTECKEDTGVLHLPNLFMVATFVFTGVTRYALGKLYDDREDNHDVDVQLVNRYVQVITERPDLVASLRNALLRDALVQQQQQQQVHVQAPAQ